MRGGLRAHAEQRRGDELGTAERSQLIPASGHLAAPKVDGSLCRKLLPPLLSVTAGSLDVISFLGMGGLFTAHITGNLVVLAAHLVMGQCASLSPILSVPVFIAVLALTRLASAVLQAIRRDSLRPLLALQFFLLFGFLAIRVVTGSELDPSAPTGIIAGMFGVAAMAVQNAVVQMSLREAPATSVMTTDITVLTLNIGTLLLEHDPKNLASARGRSNQTWPAVAGFIVGCGLGAVLQAAVGLWSLALPTSFALLALVLSFSVERDI